MSNVDAQAFGERVSQLRKKRRWTQKELAERMHIHQSMVTRWEKGQVEPRNETLERLAATFEVTVDELLSPMLMTREAPNLVADSDMMQLFSRATLLEARDRETLKEVVEAMLVRRRVKDLSLGLTG